MTSMAEIYRDNFLNVAKSESILKILVPLVAGYYNQYVMNNYVKSHKNFKPNKYFDVFALTNFNLKEFVDLLFSMIEEREGEVMEQIERKLCHLFIKILAIENLLHDSMLNK
jgi:hypothetical protein